MAWDPGEYTRFADQRSRPGADLLAQVELDAPRRILDLGCGTGWLARAMAERWPKAHVTGVDNSPEMLREAGKLTIAGRLEFALGDIAQWSPREPVDLLVSNAALQWIDDHERLLGRLAAMVNPGGVLAVQMPTNFRSPSHTAIYDTAAEPRFVAKLSGIGLRRDSVQPTAWYVEQLHQLGFSVDAWETTYVHVLAGEHPVVDWLRGTALRPVLARLDADERADFEHELAARLSAAYPGHNGVTLFPMARIFFVAIKTEKGV
jgi:trans-aconitate 2-methyltransferase